MSTWFRILFLFSSFGPLYAVLGIGLAVQHNWEALGVKGGDILALGLAAGAFVLSLLVFIALRSGFRANSPSRYAVNSIESLDENILTYLISYFPPLMIDDYSSMPKVFPMISFYVIMAIIMLKVDSIYINPYFLLCNYRIYRVRLPSGRSVILITDREEILSGEVITLYEIQKSRLFYAE